MTVERFISEAQSYYGLYNPTQRKYVEQWLSKRSETAIKYLWAEVLKTVEAKYKQPPCVADLERCYKEVRERRVELMASPPPLQIDERTVSEEEFTEAEKSLPEKLARKLAEAKRYKKRVVK